MKVLPILLMIFILNGCTIKYVQPIIIPDPYLEYQKRQQDIQALEYQRQQLEQEKLRNEQLKKNE